MYIMRYITRLTILLVHLKRNNLRFCIKSYIWLLYYSRSVYAGKWKNVNGGRTICPVVASVFIYLFIY